MILLAATLRGAILLPHLLPPSRLGWSTEIEMACRLLLESLRLPPSWFLAALMLIRPLRGVLAVLRLEAATE